MFNIFFVLNGRIYLQVRGVSFSKLYNRIWRIISNLTPRCISLNTATYYTFSYFQ